ncbi:PREDICTED: protein broad-minded-like isoform X2 [Priapulus caudatus]|nr:PREDICTED: protein broad-minded-like isoform X2 [Priapulus caudatus]
MFVVTAPHVNREIYTNLVEYIALQFSSKTRSIPSLHRGIDASKKQNSHLLLAVRLLNDFQQQLPLYWLRFSDRFLQDYIEGATSLLAISSVKDSLCPLHYMALVDPHASWFKKWMHSEYSRCVVLEHLEKYPHLLMKSVDCLLAYAANHEGTQTLTPTETTTSHLPGAHIQQRSAPAGDAIAAGVVYKEAAVKFLLALHSMQLVGELLRYGTSRSLFIQLQPGGVSLTDVIVAFTSIMLAPDSTEIGEFSAAAVARAILERIAAQNVGSHLLCRFAVMQRLLNPLIQAFHSPEQSIGTADTVHQQAILNAGCVLHSLASSKEGKHYLLYGKVGKCCKASSPCDSVVNSDSCQPDNNDIESASPLEKPVANVVVDLLIQLLPLNDAVTHPETMIAVQQNLLGICQQLYSHHDGLNMLADYRLHIALASSWRDVTREIEESKTPTPGEDEVGGLQEADQSMKQDWANHLIEGLLSFANTPKGIGMLMDTSMLHICSDLLCCQHEERYQIGEGEHHEMAALITRLASTAAGCRAIERAGLFEYAVERVWNRLECRQSIEEFEQENCGVLPDRVLQRSLLTIARFVSIYPAVYELLAGQSLSGCQDFLSRKVPWTILELVDRIVVIDNPLKILSLFSYDQSHLFGLRLLMFMCSSLDCLLLLEAQYSVQAALLAAQRDSVHEETSMVILDELSVMRNHILVKSATIGGANERVLPPTYCAHSLTFQPGAVVHESIYAWPLLTELPVPSTYVIVSTNQKRDVSKYLEGLLTNQRGVLDEPSPMWVKNCSVAFTSMLAAGHWCSQENLAELLERTSCHMARSRSPLESPASLDTSDIVQKMWSIGAKVAVEYGIRLELLPTKKSGELNRKMEEELLEVLLYCEGHLWIRQRLEMGLLRFTDGNTYPGFDWFVATVFLLFGGDGRRSSAFMKNLATLPAATFLCMPAAHKSAYLPRSVAQNGLHPVYFITGHWVELLLATELSVVHAAFSVNGISAAQLCYHWMSQCFWNYLDWKEICQYISLCLLLNIDYQVHFCMAILRHLQPLVQKHCYSEDLLLILHEQPIRDFHVEQHMIFMDDLKAKHGDKILKDMNDTMNNTEHISAETPLEMLFENSLT